jgi:hypothetical protein
MPSLSKPLVVPQYGNFGSSPPISPPFSVNLFAAGGGAPANIAAIDLITISQTLGFGFPNFLPAANVCLGIGLDLYVSISAFAGVGGNPPCAAILKFTGYFAGKNTTATAQASVFFETANGYAGLAFDGRSTLYAAMTDLNGGGTDASAIYALPLSGAAPTQVYSNLAAGAFFGDLAFDAAGNLWTADYNNNRVVAFPAATLLGTNAYTSVTATAGPFPVVNTDAQLNAMSPNLFASPEGVAFDGAGNLWAGNNNDGYDGAGIQANPLTSLVQITPGLQAAILAAATPAGATMALAPSQALTLAQVQSPAPPAGFAVYQVPTPQAGQLPQFGGMQIDVISPADLAAGAPQFLYVNDETNSTVRQFDINPASPGFLAGIGAADATGLTLNDASGNSVVTNPGNGGIFLVKASLLIADGAADTGAEPDTTLPLDSGNQPIFWESPDIGIGTSATPPAPPFTQYESLILPIPPTASAYVYVNVHNTGSTPTTGSERLRVYWASGATTQNWPSSWKEITTAPGVPVQTATNQPIAPGASAVITIPWPSAALPPTSANTHYCLLARIETTPTYPFGMTWWEDQTPGAANMPQNVIGNARIAQCNIYIGPQSHRRIPPIRPIAFPIRIGNLGGRLTNIRIGFQLLGPHGHPTDFADTRLIIRIPASLHARLPAATLTHLEADEFHLHTPAGGTGHIPFEPNEHAILHISFTPPAHLHEFALRAMQYDGDRLVGGQTFVQGTVSGL